MMITVNFRNNTEAMHEMIVPHLVTLRALQRKLCALFSARFPAMQAIVEVGGNVYDDFADAPFSHLDHTCDCKEREHNASIICACNPKVEAIVTFKANTTDPFFFDWIDRCLPKYTIEEEIAYEDASRLGETSLDFKSWLRARPF